MSKIIFILIVSIILHIAQVRNVNATDPKETKIVGGVEVEPGAAKFMVSVHYRKGGKEYDICGGSLISTTNILTAAHCFFDNEDKARDPSIIFVTMGSIIVYGDSKSFKSDISNYVLHQNYIHGAFLNDVAIIIFKGIKLNKYPNVEIMKLTNRKEKDELKCTAYGWGLTDPLDEYSYTEKLRQVDVSILDFKKCKSKFGIPRSQFCAGRWEGGEDSCKGDSGGPLVCDRKQFGIVSWGRNCSKPNQPGIYQSVHYFKKWITNDYETLGKFGNSEIVKINNFLIIYLIFILTFI